MAYITTTIWEFLKQNNETIGNATLLNDGAKLIEDIIKEFSKPGEPDWNKLANDISSLASGALTKYYENSPAGNAIAIRVAAVKLETDAGQYALARVGRTRLRYAACKESVQ